MTEKTYNGWTNYETWNVALWIDNEEGSYRYWRDTTREISEESDEKEDAIYSVSKRLEDEIKEGAPELQGTYSDLLSAALCEVNWYEIAENWVDEEWPNIEEARKEESEEEDTEEESA
jgi:hypothetical protein